QFFGNALRLISKKTGPSLVWTEKHTNSFDAVPICVRKPGHLVSRHNDSASTSTLQGINAVTLTRVAIGHSDYQEFAFPCPKCGIEIRFGMTINQESPAVEYTLLKNGEWLANDIPSQFELRFDSENL